jgi:replicative DNA helicase
VLRGGIVSAEQEYTGEVARLRTPPHSIEAETSVLGCLLLWNDAWDRAGDLLTDGDFYRHEHQLIYRAIGSLVNSAKPADVITVGDTLRDLGKLEEVGGYAYLNALAQSVAGASNIRRYAEIVRERSILRKLVAASDEIATTAFNPQGKSAAEILDMAQAAVLQVAEQGPKTTDDWESTDVGVVRYLDHINAVYSGEAKVDIIPTGLSELDNRLNGGARPGELITISMRSGMGKTAAAVTILMNAAEAGEPCAMFSMEMPRAQLHARMVSAKSHIHLTRLKLPERLRDYDWGKLSDATESIGRMNIHVNDQSSLTINQIRSKARALKRKLGRLRVIVVDHLALTRGTDAKMLRTYQLAEVTSGLKGLAKELGCVVYLLVQVNRAADARTDPMPTLADIRDTSSVEDDSDIVIFGHREYKNKPDLGDEWKYYGELAIAKQRDGELCRIPMMYVGENTRWLNWPADQEKPSNKVRGAGSAKGPL